MIKLENPFPDYDPYEPCFCLICLSRTNKKVWCVTTFYDEKEYWECPNCKIKTKKFNYLDYCKEVADSMGRVLEDGFLKENRFAK